MNSNSLIKIKKNYFFEFKFSKTIELSKFKFEFAALFCTHSNLAKVFAKFAIP